MSGRKDGDTVAPTLAAFAADNGMRRKCLVCSAEPEVRRQLEQSKGTVSYRLMADWLEDAKGYPKGSVTRHKLERHWQESHGGLDA